MIYELFGYDRYDCEYYPIGYYSTFNDALEAQKKLKASQAPNQEHDTTEVRGIKEDSDYYQKNEEEIQRLFNRDPTKEDKPVEINSKRAFFKLLDGMLSEEEKKEVLEKDIMELHFGLGMWIRNEFLYSDKYEIEHLFCESFTTPDGKKIAMMLHPDMTSETILKEYKRHLKRIRK